MFDSEIEQCCRTIAHPWWQFWMRKRRIDAAGKLRSEIWRQRQELIGSHRVVHSLAGMLDREKSP
jgi:hypothetical protein